MKKNKSNDRMVNTIFALLLFCSLMLFAGIPAVNQADNISQATSKSGSK
jgi:hypothetical protein